QQRLPPRPRRYILGLNVTTVPPAARPLASKGYYFLKSVGPNNVDDRDGAQVPAPGQARIYDPTNGTISDGDIVTFSDTEILATQRGS
ncbi:MAG: hypothetical protein HC893_08400, partial [Chloroflexaceae bacterium]|nr:hypothetical protein [Chloroflexaceae bacterium]